ncbi:MAG TPA: tRNA (adenosine(37)-N6)-threonylcarbamoyltransferase complex ATPase subunit type 1 TsaE [Chitinophagaceae bacterium]|nr:tRNA (adenosine(37)-N6)-threonylcarbamoyltransferase complex ATPase subunit type 1 TsaE [Chitinophagaceae bacterium]
MERTFQLRDLPEVAREIWREAGEHRVLAFHGDMGVGKTTLIHALCSDLGVRDAVGSPTFSLINEYHFMRDGAETELYHIDLYRLKDEEEARQAGVEDCLYSGSLCLVEWPDRAPGLLPADTLHLYLSLEPAGNRTLRIAHK